MQGLCIALRRTWQGGWGLVRDEKGGEGEIHAFARESGDAQIDAVGLIRTLIYAICVMNLCDEFR